MNKVCPASGAVRGCNWRTRPSRNDMTFRDSNEPLTRRSPITAKCPECEVAIIFPNPRLPAFDGQRQSPAKRRRDRLYNFCEMTQPAEQPQRVKIAQFAEISHIFRATLQRRFQRHFKGMRNEELSPNAGFQRQGAFRPLIQRHIPRSQASFARFVAIVIRAGLFRCGLMTSRNRKPSPK